MATGDKQVEFTKDFSVHKKGAKFTFSRDLASMLVGRKVAKEVNSKAVGRKPKAKAKK